MHINADIPFSPHLLHLKQQKATMRTPAILASFLLILPALGQQSGYTYSCWGEYLSGTTLNAFCNDSLDREWTTWIDLNICLINGHGTLYCQAG